jgi:hypothetical protein
MARHCGWGVPSSFPGVSPRRADDELGPAVEHGAPQVSLQGQRAVHDLLVIERGWTSEQYERWITDG